MNGMANTIALFYYGKILIGIVLAGLSIYTLILATKALKIYIKKN